jgi:hypothetical protein
MSCCIYLKRFIELGESQVSPLICAPNTRHFTIQTQSSQKKVFFTIAANVVSYTAKTCSTEHYLEKKKKKKKKLK